MHGKASDGQGFRPLEDGRRTGGAGPANVCHPFPLTPKSGYAIIVGKKCSA